MKTQRTTIEELDLDTVQGRLRGALLSIGLSTAPEIQRKWKDYFKRGIARQTVHRWLNGPIKFIEYEYLFDIAELTNHSAIWIATGRGGPTAWRPISPEQSEVLDIFDNLEDEGRRERWVSAGRDALAGQHVGNGRMFTHPPAPRRPEPTPKPEPKKVKSGSGN